MTTAALGVAVALRTALADLAGGRVYLNRLRPLPADAATAIVVRLDRSIGRQDVLNMLDWTTLIGIECVARAATGTDPAAAVDALLAAAWSVISGLSSAALGATSIAINPDIAWQYDDADSPFVVAVIAVQVQHRTPFASLS